MLQHTGLDDAQLGPRLARLLAPSSPLPAREMVARGLAPLAGAEPWLALYQLWVRGGATLADQASRTASDLPVAAVMTALMDPHLPAVVLDFIARRRIHSPETLRLIVHHPRVHDATLRLLARCAPEGVCGAVARNQRRWLACPAIAEQLLLNPCCDRATAHAVLELGAREAVTSLAELRSLTLAGAVLQDSPEAHARAIAWMLRSGPADIFPELAGAATHRRAPSGEPDGQGLPAPATAGRGLSLRPGSPEGQGLPAPATSGRALSLRPGSPAPRNEHARPSPSEPPIGLSLRPGPSAPSIGLSLRPGPPAPSIGLSLRPGPPASSPPSPASSPPSPASSPPTRPTPPSPASSPPTRPAPPTPSLGLTLRPAPAAPPQRPAPNASEGSPDAPAVAPTRSRGLSFQTALPSLDELDELDLPIADDWDELDPSEIPPPAPVLAPAHRAQQTPALAVPPRVVRAARPGAARSYSERLELVLDPRTPLTLAMSQLHRLRAPDLRRIAAARRLPTALITAARRRVGTA